ncbi:serpentine type 7TM GPCR chemoreceptor srh domain-containing protein [Ditylenchus destructor]|nr:serpentine type 7TM GPCR chemoreceptor srh domain-containing protein [Ditylenchus destructor]
MDLNQNSSSSEPPNDYGLYVWFMRLNAILDTLISILVIYLIFKHTPKAMKVYKWFLLNLSLCCYLLDAHLTITFLPIPIFPVFGGCALGLMRPLGYMAPVVAWNYPNFLLFYESHSCAVMMLNSEMLIRYLYTTMPTVILASVLVTTPIILITRQLSKVKHTVSAKTYKMHRSLTLSLCFQFALVSIMLVLSGVICGVASIYQWKFAQTIFYVSFLFSTMHTAANGIITIAFVKPYREAFFALLPFIRQKRNMTTAVVRPELMTSNVLFSRYSQ